MNRKKIPTLNFAPLFYILDKACKWVMVVEKEDQYEYKGIYIAYYGYNKWQTWPACKNKQHLREYPASFKTTKSKDEAINWAYHNRHLPDTQDVSRERDPNFPKY